MTTEGPDRTVIACSLSASDATAQLAEWSSLRAACARVETSEAGARLWFDPTVEGRLREVAAREAQCCTFLDLRVSTDGALILLEIASTSSGARTVIEILAAHAGDSRGRG